MMSGFIDKGATHAQTHERLEAIVATAMDAIICVDEAQHIICFNPAAERLFGISARDVMRTPIKRFIPDRLWENHEGLPGAISALRADGEEISVEASFSQTEIGTERMSTVILRDITERRANEEAQALLAREVDHRAKNILAIVSSLVSLTQAPTREAYAESLAGRIAAMSRAHGLLARGRWQGAALMQVVLDELGAYADPESFTCEGPDLKLSPRAVQPIGMLIHELATNAVKYGALSTRGGHVALRWTQGGDENIEMVWSESGGPPVTRPAAPGFGSDLIQQIVRNQLNGSLDHHWGRDGYRLQLILPENILQAGDGSASGRRTGREGAAAMSQPSQISTDLSTLLIVEDEPLLAMQMSRSLTEFGWSILGVAGSIEEANRLLSDTHAKRPDAAILDVDLGGMPVFPLARSLRKLGIPFLFCTGYEDLEYVQEFASYCAIRKPATVLQIVRGLREVVRGAQADLSAQPSA